jgi:hypothetical protein
LSIFLKTAAEYQAGYIGNYKSAYMKYWWWWHNHKNEPERRARQALFITSEAALTKFNVRLVGKLIPEISFWFNQNCPDESKFMKETYGEIPTLEEIRKYQMDSIDQTL